MRNVWRGSMAVVAVALAASSLTPGAELTAGAGAAAERAPAQALRGGLPADFIANRGQWQGPARFAARRGEVAAALEPDRIRLRRGHVTQTTITLVFEGASAHGTVEGEDRRAGVYNFIEGRKPSAWRTDVPAYGSVLYRQLYQGVDVRVREEARHFEYDIVLAPHADLAQVVVRVEGAQSLELGSDGSLLVHTDGEPLRQTPPVTVERTPDGGTRPVASRFRLIDDRHYGFEAAERNESLPLVIDPGLIWSTLTGGSGGEQLAGIEAARDGSGDLFISGSTSSADFATTPTPVQSSRYKAFVARLDASGSRYDFVTFINGLQNQTYAGTLAADAGGGVTMVGTTVDLDFPITAGAFQPHFASASTGQSLGDAFITRFNATGGLVFSTYLGGSDNDGATAVAIDSTGAVIVAGTTSSANFPTTAGAYDRSYNAPPAGDNTAYGSDTFIARLSADGSQLTYATFFGGQTYEAPHDAIVDPQGYVTIAGVTTSSATGRDIPVTADGFDRTWNGAEDGFIARFKLDGGGAADLKYSSFLGGVNLDAIEGIAFDPGNPQLVTVAGHSWYDMLTGPFFPTTAGVFKPALTPISPPTPLFPHSKTGFVAKFRFPSAGPGSLVWSTFAGGNWEDFLSDVAVDETGAAIVVGGTRSYDLPTTRGAIDRTQDGVGNDPHDCFIWKLSPNGDQLLYSSYLGGTYGDCEAVLTIGGKLAYLGSNTIAVAGMTGSGDFETTAGAVRTVADEVADGNNAFVAKLTLAADASGDLVVSTPTLLSPVSGSRTGGSGGVVRFQWSAVEDPSGIEGYVYEISTRPDFPPNFTQYKGSVNSTEVILESIAISTPWYWRVRAADRAGNLSAWSAASTFTAGVAGAAPIVNFVQIYPVTVAGGGSAQGVLHITDPAPAGGVEVVLSTRDPRGFLRTTSPIGVPASVFVPAGAISANFPITTTVVGAATPAAIYATVGAIGAKGTMTVVAASVVRPASLTLEPLVVTGGNPATGTVTLTGPAPAGGATVPLLSSHPGHASVPATVTVPAGAASASFPIVTAAVPFAFDVAIEAAGGQSAARRLALRPGGPRLTSFTLSANTASGGSTLTGTLRFSGPIPPAPFPATGDALVAVKSTHPAAGLSPIVAVPVGSTSATFSIGVRNVPATTPLEIVAAYDDTVLRAPVTITGTAAALASMTLNVSTLTGGQGGVGFVNLTAPAPAGHVLISLSSDNPAISLPADVTVSAGTTNGLFSFGASPVTTRTVATMTARYGASSASAVVTINPSLNVWVTSLALNPATVTGGTASTGTVTINAPAPPGGATVQLSAMSPATVPATVTIPAGATSASFAVSTTSVAAAAQSKVWALLNTTWGAVLTVTPGGPPATPAAPALLAPANGATVSLPITFDWSDVSGAASYEIQVDDSSAFSSPRVIEQSVSTSQLTVASLAIREHWWRVRAVNGAGTAGAWSAVRSVTPRAAPNPPPPTGTASLTVSVTGRSGERVTSSPSGISVPVGSSGSASFATGTSVTLSVSNGREAVWSGACSSGGNKAKTCRFTQSANASVSANVK